MRRREFIAGLLSVGTAANARAQPAASQHQIGILMNRTADDPQGRGRLASFLEGLKEWGWAVGQNLRLETRWAAGNTNLYLKYAEELVALNPDVIVATNTSTTRALLQVTNSIPIVFTSATDPVAGGLVVSLARPGGNVTGFASAELGLSAKWLELLRELAPGLVRVAVLRDSTTTGGVGQFAAIQTAAAAFRVELTAIDLRDAGEIERAIAAFARGEKGGLIMISAARAELHRKLIITLAARYQLPSVYPFRYDVVEGGLMSYGPDVADQYRRAAQYVDRILKGAKPADLPVQEPAKYDLVINLRTAKALGLEVPPILLARAELIE